MTTPQPESIGEKVRFWEEQDRINQQLIPRVIRQNELLTQHIAEHDSLQEIVGNAVQEAVAIAREEHQRQLDSALAKMKEDLDQQVNTAVRQATVAIEQKSIKTRNLLMGLVAGTGAIAVAAIILSLLTL